MARRRPNRSWRGCRPTPPRRSPTPDPGVRAEAVAPIIVTATMGAADQRWADGLRRRWFPPERNRLAAHITFFHQLPPSCEAELLGRMAAICAREAPPAAIVERPYALGRGVALLVASPGLSAMRAELAANLHGLLGAQDIGAPRLHITVQNKAAPAEARAALGEIARDWAPRPLVVRGLAAWRYLGGPWAPIAEYAFRGAARRGH